MEVPISQASAMATSYLSVEGLGVQDLSRYLRASSAAMCLSIAAIACLIRRNWLPATSLRGLFCKTLIASSHLTAQSFALVVCVVEAPPCAEGH